MTDNWQEYFDQSYEFTKNNITFQLYKSTIASSGKDKKDVDDDSSFDPPILFMHHGAGQSSYSWILFIRECEKLFPPGTELVCYDCFQHGKTSIQKEFSLINASSFDSDGFSIENLSKDLVDCYDFLFENQCSDALKRTIFIGHSLGGAVIAHVISNQMFPISPLGVVLVDIAEECALQSVIHLRSVIRNRPKFFDSIEDAIDYSLKTKLIQNKASANISIPNLLKNNGSQWEWITDLNKSEPYWNEWFNGLTKKFLKSSTNKLLVLADTNRLDKELLIAQMQGHFQLQMVRGSGHAIQEDAPDQLASIIYSFWKRYSHLMMSISGMKK